MGKQDKQEIMAILKHKSLGQLKIFIQQNCNPDTELALYQLAILGDCYLTIAYKLAWGMRLLSDLHFSTLSQFFEEDAYIIYKYNLPIDGRIVRALKRMQYITGDFDHGWNITEYGKYTYRIEKIRRLTEARLHRKIEKEAKS